MSTFDKIKSYRQRRDERLTHRAMTRRRLDTSRDTARAEMMLYSNRIW